MIIQGTELSHILSKDLEFSRECYELGKSGSNKVLKYKITFPSGRVYEHPGSRVTAITSVGGDFRGPDHSLIPALPEGECLRIHLEHMAPGDMENAAPIEFYNSTTIFEK